MAVLLNKNRKRDVKILVLLSVLVILFTKQLFPDATFSHETLELIGYGLVIVCVLGRIYCTAFLGGHKNNTLITYGPFSMCRNPLYFFSFIGACGIAIMTTHIVLMIILPIAFYAIFQFVMKREEMFLVENFGENYLEYQRGTPRFFPNVSIYNAPESVTMYPRYLINGIKDSALWFLSLPALEAIEFLHQTGIVGTIFMMP